MSDQSKGWGDQPPVSQPAHQARPTPAEQGARIVNIDDPAEWEALMAAQQPQTMQVAVDETPQHPDGAAPSVTQSIPPTVPVRPLEGMPINPDPVSGGDRDDQVLAAALDAAAVPADGYEKLTRATVDEDPVARRLEVGTPAVLRVQVRQSGLREFQIQVPDNRARRPRWVQAEMQDSEPWWTLVELDGIDLLDMGIASTVEASDYDKLTGVRTMALNCVPLDDVASFRRHLKLRRLSMDELVVVIEAIGEAIAGVPS